MNYQSLPSLPGIILIAEAIVGFVVVMMSLISSDIHVDTVSWNG